MLFGNITLWRTVRRKCSPEDLALSNRREVDVVRLQWWFTQKNSADSFNDIREQPGMGLVQGVVTENQHEGLGSKHKITPKKHGFN